MHKHGRRFVILQHQRFRRTLMWNTQEAQLNPYISYFVAGSLTL